MQTTPTLIVLFASVVQAAGLGGDPPAVAFVNVHVVTMESEKILAEQTVIVRGDRIQKIGAVANVEVPEDALRIEGHGAYLMPGLFDLHVHLQDDVDPELYVLNGVTTVRELDGSPLRLWQRDRIDSGDLLGPQLFISSPPILRFGEGLAGDALKSEARKIVEREIERGYTFLKIYNYITADGYGALVRAAREAGIRPIGHIPRNLRLDQVLAHPPDSIDHAEEFLYSRFFIKEDDRRPSGRRFDSAAIPAVARNVAKSKVAVVTTLSTYDHIGRQVADLAAEFERGEVRYASALHLRDWAADRNRHKHFKKSSAARFRSALAFQKKFLGVFHDEGVPILLGTDSGGEGIPFVFAGFSAHEELVHLTDCGLSAYEAIAAATREPARFLGILPDVGTIAAGKRADLILVWGNPLEDVRNAALRAGVMVRGRWIPSKEIHARLDRIAEQSRREVEFVRAIRERGVEGAREVLARSRADEPSLIPFRDHTLNELGYEALKIARDVDLAVSLFELNAKVYSTHWNMFDSLGEGLAARGDIDAAIRSYERSLELFSGNHGGAEMIAELRSRRKAAREQKGAG